MNIEELKGLQKQITSLRSEVEQLDQRSHRYSLSDYVHMFNQKIGIVDHGSRDRFTVPYYDAVFKLNALIALGDHEINSSFASNKRKLISCMNRYVKGIDKGFISHEKELNGLK